MNKYNAGKIYKIVNDVNDEIYVGSTINDLRVRYQGHKDAWRKQVNGEGNSDITLYNAFSEIGIQHFRISLIENFPCQNKEDLCKREEYYRVLLNANYNTHVSHRSKESRKEYLYQWYLTNKEKRHNQTQNYRERHAAKFVCDACDFKTCDYAKLKRHNNTKKHILEYPEYIFDIEMDRLADITIFD